MSRLVLYRAIASPPARSVMMLGDLLGLQFEYRDVKLMQLEHKSEQYKKNINPMGTVPVLQDGDFTLSESHAILQYLCEQHGGARGAGLLPAQAQARARMHERLFFNAGYLFPRMADVAIPLLLFGEDNFTDMQIYKIDEAFGALEQYLRQTRFVANDEFTLADLAVGATATATNVLLELDQNRYPRVAEWMKELQEMPCFKNVNAEGIAYFKKFIAKAKERKLKSE